MKFPEAVAKTTLKPDIVLTSAASKQLSLLVLILPWEDSMEEVNERKRARYSALVEECWSNGWLVRCQPIEVGCRGFAGKSICRAFKMLGIRGVSYQSDI